MRTRLILTAAVLAVSAAACSDSGPASPEFRGGAPRAETHGNAAPGNSHPAPPPPSSNVGPAVNADPPPPDTSRNGRGPFYGSGG